LLAALASCRHAFITLAIASAIIRNFNRDPGVGAFRAAAKYGVMGDVFSPGGGRSPGGLGARIALRPGALSRRAAQSGCGASAPTGD